MLYIVLHEIECYIVNVATRKSWVLMVTRNMV